MDYSKLAAGEWLLESGSRVLFDRNQRPLRVCRAGMVHELHERSKLDGGDRDRAPGTRNGGSNDDEIEPSLNEHGPLNDGDQIELICWFKLPGMSLSMAAVERARKILDIWPDPSIEIARSMNAGLYERIERQLVRDDEPSAEDRRLARNAAVRAARAKHKEPSIVTTARNLEPEARMAMFERIAPDTMLDVGMDELCESEIDLEFYRSLELE